MITINIIKSIKDAIVANDIQAKPTAKVMWDVCTKSYKFFIDKNVDMYYHFPDGTTCLNINPIFNIEELMTMSDEEASKVWDEYCEEYKRELSNMVQYYKDCK